MNLTSLPQLIEKRFNYLVETRRHLHQNPEISYHEFDTTEFIVSELQKLECEIVRPLKTGCLAIFKGNNPDSRVIALRADIDALKMQEYGDAKSAFLSTRENAAHCCGHDAHTTNLLGTAKNIQDLLPELEGTVVLIFQPGEEKLPGGGRLLMESGALHKLGIQRIYGLHTYPHAKPGVVLCRNAELMARPDEFEITFTGKGGHAAAPHRTVDTIVMAAQFVTAAQTVVSRNTDPTEKAVVTVGYFHGGQTYNVIPEKVDLKGTIRSFSKETADMLSGRLKEMAKHISAGFGGSADFTYNPGYPAVINHADTTRRFMEIAEKALGKEHVQWLERPIMAGEDFAFYQEEIPGTFFFLGSGTEETDSRWDWHHPKYNVDEEAMKTGTLLLTKLAFQG